MNKNLAMFVGLVVGIFVFGLVVMMQVPRKETVMQTLPVTADVAVAASVSTDFSLV